MCWIDNEPPKISPPLVHEYKPPNHNMKYYRVHHTQETGRIIDITIKKGK